MVKKGDRRPVTHTNKPTETCSYLQDGCQNSGDHSPIISYNLINKQKVDFLEPHFGGWRKPKSGVRKREKEGEVCVLKFYILFVGRIYVIIWFIELY